MCFAAVIILMKRPFSCCVCAVKIHSSFPPWLHSFLFPGNENTAEEFFVIVMTTQKLKSLFSLHQLPCVSLMIFSSLVAHGSQQTVRTQYKSQKGDACCARCWVVFLCVCVLVHILAENENR